MYVVSAIHGNMGLSQKYAHGSSICTNKGGLITLLYLCACIVSSEE